MAEEKYSAKERKDMWTKIYKGNKLVKIIIVPNIEMVVTGRDVGYSVVQVPDKIKNISATKVREGDLEHVPEEIKNDLIYMDNITEVESFGRVSEKMLEAITLNLGIPKSIIPNSQTVSYEYKLAWLPFWLKHTMKVDLGHVKFKHRKIRNVRFHVEKLKCQNK